MGEVPAWELVRVPEPVWLQSGRRDSCVPKTGWPGGAEQARAKYRWPCV